MKIAPVSLILRCPDYNISPLFRFFQELTYLRK